MAARNNLISGIILLVTTGIFYFAAEAIEEDPFGVGMQPYVFPKVVCIGLGILILLHLVSSLRALAHATVDAGQETPSETNELKVFALWVLPMAGIAFAYIGAMQLVQYPLATMVCLSATLALFGNRGVKWLVIFPVVFASVYYLVFFGLFRLLEPRGMWLEYDNYYLFGPLRKFFGL